MAEISGLKRLTPVLIHGPDARKFMQGQLTSDVRTLSPFQALLGSCNSGQGRVQAVVTLIEREEGLIGLFPTQTLERVLGKLRASVLGSKLSLERSALVVESFSPAQVAAVVESAPQRPGACAQAGGARTLLRWWGAEERYLSIGPVPPGPEITVPDTSSSDSSDADLRWRRSDIACGLPQVYAETQTSFIPQMLNLDLLGAVSFDKGCYVGQEVVARARRGGVPRRMFGFTAACPSPAPGTRVLRGDTQVGEVVDAIDDGQGCSLLAVVELEATLAPLCLEGAPESKLTSAALPYAVPTQWRA